MSGLWTQAKGQIDNIRRYVSGSTLNSQFFFLFNFKKFLSVTSFLKIARDTRPRGYKEAERPPPEKRASAGGAVSPSGRRI